MQTSNKKTLVIGASLNEGRISHRFVKLMDISDNEVIALGSKTGMIANTELLTGQPDIADVHTISLYINEVIQQELEAYILSLDPKRIIFNPGAENHGLAIKAKEKNIEVIFACGLVMFKTGQY